MKQSRCTESRIFQTLKEAESGVPVPELCRNHGMSSKKGRYTLFMMPTLHSYNRGGKDLLPNSPRPRVWP
jgi:hypothetical protein